MTGSTDSSLPHFPFPLFPLTHVWACLAAGRGCEVLWELAVLGLLCLEWNQNGVYLQPRKNAGVSQKSSKPPHPTQPKAIP